jgi:hypothetical protein
MEAFDELTPTRTLSVPVQASAHVDCRMKAFTAAVALAGLLSAAVPAHSLNNTVVQWQNAVEQVVRDYNISNQISARYYALTNIAQYQVCWR